MTRSPIAELLERLMVAQAHMFGQILRGEPTSYPAASAAPTQNGDKPVCSCPAHRELVACTCNCDHTADRLRQWRDRALAAEAGNAHNELLLFLGAGRLATGEIVVTAAGVPGAPTRTVVIPPDQVLFAIHAISHAAHEQLTDTASRENQ